MPYFTSCDLCVYLCVQILPYNPSIAPHHRANAPIMGAWSYVRSIYALDTIDTRFTTSASTPHKAVAAVRADSARSNPKKDGSARGSSTRVDSGVMQPSRWNTLEFYFYYFVFITCIPYMFWIAYDVSRRECDCNWEHYGILHSSQHRIKTTTNSSISSRPDGYRAAEL